MIILLIIALPLLFLALVVTIQQKMKRTSYIIFFAILCDIGVQGVLKTFFQNYTLFIASLILIGVSAANSSVGKI